MARIPAAHRTAPRIIKERGVRVCKYKNLIENWLPPSLQIDKFDVEDDQAWLFQRKPKQMRVEEKHVCTNDTTCGSSALWPRAQYIHDADFYALPYTLPF
ncbi:hypothetical protein HAX54_011324 [Datura stramonium]|uniref:Uncharacterized protein n=1 Tax=Datura stramonium TaxID=4076 RepID=A0ABS8THR2_DATST|nr:hypothetical protein [Datura stramonium]